MLSQRRTPGAISTPYHAAVMENRAPSGCGGGSATPLSQLEMMLVKLPSTYVIPLSGAVGGAVSGIVSCPLDVIKTKLQAQGGFTAKKSSPTLASAAYRGIKGTARTIWQEEGLRGMYRGLGPMLLGYVPTWAVYLTAYNKAQCFFNTKTDNKFMANVYASILGGTCSTLVTNPVWVIKTRLMSQSNTRIIGSERAPWHYRNTLDAARKMYLTEGMKSFYAGLTPGLLGLSHVAIQFPLYEFFKLRFTGLGSGPETEEYRQTHFYSISLAIFLSKVIASTATYPHEVVRTRLQTQQRSYPHHAPEDLSFRGKGAGEVRPPGGSSSDGMINSLRYRGTIQTCKVILAEEGWRGFYAGLGTNLIRAVPSAMTTILTFEYLKKAIVEHQAIARAKLEGHPLT